MSSAERRIKLLLRINGYLAVLASVAVLMPHSWLVWCVDKVEPNLTVLPLVSYLARSLSSLFVLMGAMLLVFATDIRRYALPIRVLMLWCWFGVAALAVHGIPHASVLFRQWFFWCVAVDGIYGLAVSSAVLFLQRRVPIQDPEETP